MANKRHRAQTPAKAAVKMQTVQLNPAVSRYFQRQQISADAADWLQASEIPSSEEVTRQPGVDEEIACNIAHGQWPSKSAFLQAHYDFLREEAVRPLRVAVQQLKVTPGAHEEGLNGGVGIYEKVRIIAVVTSTRGIAMRITFSTNRAGKRIRWEQATRLLSGTLVALTPSDDMFRKTTIVATVAARPLLGLQQDPPELDLFFARSEELELNPAVEWTMIEARSSFFEAERHTLLALQRMIHEPFPLEEYIVSGITDVHSPAYLVKQPEINLEAISTGETSNTINVLEAWPETTDKELDASQLAAVERIITKALSIIQGPPGTGKTFVSVKAIQIMLANQAHDDPPIIVTAQTNHALDQLLRHIAEFQPDFARLGGRSKDQEVILKRTMYNLRQEAGNPRVPGCQTHMARRDMSRLEKEIEELLSPLKVADNAIDPNVLQALHILTEKQATTLTDGASEWVQATPSTSDQARSPFMVWLAQALIRVPYKPGHGPCAFEFEEADLEFEQLKEIEAEGSKEDDFTDMLTGKDFAIADNYTSAKVNSMAGSAVEHLLKKTQDLWDIPEGSRPSVYRYLQQRLKDTLLKTFRAKARDYDMAAQRAKVGRFERDETILRQQKVIGLTTTGLSKYRGLIASLGCKIVLVEEAAETLEAPVIAACIPTLQHLILVGDHRQLRPHCKVAEHERKPFNWNISMFERLVNNAMGMTTLTKQRRMIPEIRRILRPIYGDIIQDHDFVKNRDNRPDVPGMGGINSYFFTHHWPEQRDNTMSCVNPREAKMIVGLVEHLVHNNVDSHHITVLTFYNGQRKEILRNLKESTALTGRYFNVVTVDSYQGEENKVVILSLVRSNEKNAIGFLSVDNRVCVALSRAQCGLYIFGNGMLLNDKRYKTWVRVIKIMAGLDGKHEDEIPKIEPSRLHERLPIQCTTHDNRLLIAQPEDWVGLAGGCREPCAKRLGCGHICPLACHPTEHDILDCTQPCLIVFACGHQCSRTCSQSCYCQKCGRTQQEHTLAKRAEGSIGNNSERSSSTSSWARFAKDEPIRYDQAVAMFDDAMDRGTVRSTRSSPLKREVALINFEEDDNAQAIVAQAIQEELLIDMSDISLL